MTDEFKKASTMPKGPTNLRPTPTMRSSKLQRYQDAVVRQKKNDGLCKLSDGVYCGLSREAVEAGYRKTLVTCNSKNPDGCGIYLKAKRYETLEEILGLSHGND